VSLFDDASRLLTHSAFCLGETALDIEGVLKQALLKRGRPIKPPRTFFRRVLISIPSVVGWGMCR
jgi:hypothetical protein